MCFPKMPSVWYFRVISLHTSVSCRAECFKACIALAGNGFIDVNPPSGCQMLTSYQQQDYKKSRKKVCMSDKVWCYGVFIVPRELASKENSSFFFFLKR